MQHKSYSLKNFRDVAQINSLPEELITEIKIAGSVFPFKANNYITEQLINWNNIPDDPIFTATFPTRKMLQGKDYAKIKALFESGAPADAIKEAVDEIRLRLNPHPAGQLEYNTPFFEGQNLAGVQHKYPQTVLLFPEQGQSCHAYCTFCFRWPQFAQMPDYKISSPVNGLFKKYLEAHPSITDVLITGGDPMIMKTKIVERYIEPLLDPELSHIKNIRIGTRALSSWPYRFTTDDDADDLLRLFSRITKSGKHLAFMANVTHPVELQTEAVKKAICRVQEAGAVIRTQAPLLNNINASPEIWAKNWEMQVSLNMVPYYMFIARDTGAWHHFSVPLVKAWQIFKQAYQSVSGICRTVRGPSMSCLPGKVMITGVDQAENEKFFVLQMLQARNPDWVLKPFYASWDEKATWYDELKPAFGQDKFFFSDELDEMLKSSAK